MVWEMRPSAPAPQVVRFSFGPPAGHSLAFMLGGTTLAISPDGTEVVFSGQHGGPPQLYVRRMDRLESVSLNGTENANYPFFSPDGNWVGFFADHKLKKAPVAGGAPVTLCDAPSSRGGTWAPDDTIIFGPSTASGLMRVAAAGGTPQPFTKLDSGKAERTHRWPEVLPDRKTVLFASGLEFNTPIVVADLKSGVVKTLPIRGGYPRYVPGGYLAFVRPDGLFAVPFNLQRLEVTGSLFPVLQPLASATTGAAVFAISETGSLAYIPAGATIGNFSWVNRKGALEQLGSPARDYLPAVRVSPDGKRVFMVMRNQDGYRDVWMYDILRGAMTRLTFGEGDNAGPVVSPDGRRIAFTRWKDGTYGLLTKSADGSGPEETLLPPQDTIVAPNSWSPDGKFLAYWQVGRTGKFETWLLPLEGDRKPRLFLANQFDQNGAAFSPDGKFVAYMSTESGHNEVYVTSFPQGSGKLQISTSGGTIPVWGRNGKELFYRDGGNIMGVEVTTQPAFSASAPRVIVPAAALANVGNVVDNFDISPDGQRFLVHQQSSEPGQIIQIQYVLNWSQEVQHLAPTNK
jgi:serine/threonine-protein kinase